MFTNPAVSDFKSYFVRDFPFGTDITQNILDADITRALSEATVKINESLFSTQEEYSLAFYYLSAHILAMNIQQSSQGLNSKFDWPYSSKSVGSVSVGQSIPQEVLSNPIYAYYSKTAYGVEYLLMIYPRVIGNIFSIEGATNP